MTVTEFVKQYHKAFVRAVMAYRISSENAEDLCQACYVQWLQRKNPIKIVQPERFLKTVAKRLARDSARKQNNQPLFIPLDALPEKLYNTGERFLNRGEEFADRYRPLKLQVQALEKIMLDYVLGQAKPTTILNLLIQYNSGITIREISATIEMSTRLIHKEIVQWRNWLKQFGES